MSAHYARVVFGLLALSLGWLLVACATQEDLRSTSRDLLGKNEELRNELKEARQRSAELETTLREIKSQDLSEVLGQLETHRRDIEGLQGSLDDQKAQIYSLDQKLATQTTRLQEVLTTIEDARTFCTSVVEREVTSPTGHPVPVTASWESVDSSLNRHHL